MINVYRYGVTIYGGTDDEQNEDLIVIGNSEKNRKEYFQYMSRFSSYSLISKHKFSADEVMERFSLSVSHIEEILNGVNLELEDCDSFNDDYFEGCKLSIEELRTKRKIDSEDFDAKGIIEKIAKEHAITPKRKEALIRCIEKL